MHADKFRSSDSCRVQRLGTGTTRCKLHDTWACTRLDTPTGRPWGHLEEGAHREEERSHKTTRSYDHSGVFAHAKWQHISIVTHTRPPARGAALEHAVPINCKHRQTYNLTLPAHPHAAGCLQLHRYLGAAQPADPPQRPDRQPLLPPHSPPPLPPLFPLGRHGCHRR